MAVGLRLALGAVIWLAAGWNPAPAQTADPLLDVPFLAQPPELCGGAAAAMVLRYWGAQGVVPEDFSHLVSDSAGGIFTDDLKSAVEGFGFHAVAFRGDADELRRHLDLGRPTIVLLEVARDTYHYTVITGWLDDRFLLHDPVRGAFRAPDLEDMIRSWKAAGHWTLLVLPSEDNALESEASPAAPGAVAEDDACGRLVAHGVSLAREGRLEEGGAALDAGAERCPSESAPLRELAGLRLRQGDFDAAAELAARAVALSNTDAHSLQTLGAARYLAGRELDALAAWNRLGRPRIDHVDVRARRAKPPEVIRHLGLRSGEPLSPGSLETARRRLGELPAARASRLWYAPRSDGTVQVVAAVQERSGLPTGVAELGASGVRALVSRTVEVQVAGPLHAGDAWWAGWGFEEHRPRLYLAMAAPLPPTGAVWRAEGLWQRETFLAAVEERARASLEVSRWETGAVRWHLRTSVDRWRDRGRYLSLGTGGQLRLAGDRLAASAKVEGWSSPDGGDAFAAGAAALEWRSAARPEGLLWSARAGTAFTGAEAPRGLWPGAGEGRARPYLLRAHPLLEGGVVAGPAFGRLLVHGGVEAFGWLPPEALGLPVRSGLTAFLDLAAVGAETEEPTAGQEAARRFHADMGLGIRIGLPSGRGALRLDLARGWRDGAVAATAGWETPWPRLAG